MRPFRILQVDSLPRSASGKVDRKAASEYVRNVLQQDGRKITEQSQVDNLQSPEDAALEKRLLELLAGIIGDISGTESWLTAHTLLREAGVDSLRAMRLLHAIRTEWPDSKNMQPPISLLLDPAATIRSVFFTATSSKTAFGSDSLDKEKWKNQLAEFASRNMNESLRQLKSVNEADIEMILPMTSTQNQLAVNFAKDHRNYISHTVLSLKAEISTEALENSINTVLHRNGIYRCAMVSCNDDISPFAQVVLKPEAWTEWTHNNPRVVRQQGKITNDSQE
jgi:aryl carrier-like protein